MKGEAGGVVEEVVAADAVVDEEVAADVAITWHLLQQASYMFCGRVMI